MSSGWPAKRVETRSITPGVSILEHGDQPHPSTLYIRHIRLAFEVFHNIQKLVVHLSLIDEADFDLVEIT